MSEQFNIIKDTALRTLHIEKEAIARLPESINNDFVNCIVALYESTGRIVLTGIGKSAIIAQKICATLNSTGAPSLFMHAADAVHGDLGMIRKEDIVIVISKSGETEELKILIPYIKQNNNLLIAIVSNLSSNLALSADFCLHTPIIEEAEPNNLAPTASTLSQMAMGDAIAASLLAISGFGEKEFAQFHPAGSLGKKLTLSINDIYIKNEKPIVHTSDDIRKVIMEITSKRLGATAVLNGKSLVGIITDGDIRRMLENNTSFEKLHAQDIMTQNPKTVLPNQLASEALEIMKNLSITQLLVFDEKYLGIVHLHDILKEGIV
jgi:arabinose-5-phosphate isomerase